MLNALIIPHLQRHAKKQVLKNHLPVGNRFPRGKSVSHGENSCESFSPREIVGIIPPREIGFPAGKQLEAAGEAITETNLASSEGA